MLLQIQLSSPSANYPLSPMPASRLTINAHVGIPYTAAADQTTISISVKPTAVRRSTAVSFGMEPHFFLIVGKYMSSTLTARIIANTAAASTAGSPRMSTIPAGFGRKRADHSRKTHGPPQNCMWPPYFFGHGFLHCYNVCTRRMGRTNPVFCLHNRKNFVHVFTTDMRDHDTYISAIFTR